jgi:hypothetical protein
MRLRELSAQHTSHAMQSTAIRRVCSTTLLRPLHALTVHNRRNTASPPPATTESNNGEPASLTKLSRASTGLSTFSLPERSEVSTTYHKLNFRPQLRACQNPHLAIRLGLLRPHLPHGSRVRRLSRRLCALLLRRRAQSAKGYSAEGAVCGGLFCQGDCAGG